MRDVSPEALPLACVQRWAQQRPDQPYLIQPLGGGRIREWTWAQTVDEARRIAAALLDEGRRRGWPARANVAILSKNCAHWILADLAIWMAGYVSVPLYPTLNADSVRKILAHSEAVACIVGKLDDFPAMRPGIPDTLWCVGTPLAPDNDYAQWDELLQRYSPLPDIARRRASELATIIYTSGTTGMPKGVMHSFASFATATEAMQSVFPVGPEDRVLSYLPLAHVAERVAVEANSISAGYRVYFAESLDTFLDDLRRARPTVFFSVPRLWVKFQQGIFAKIPKRKLDRLWKLPLVGRLVKRRILRELGLDSVTFAATGAAPLPESVLSWYRELGLDLLEVYGMTENFGVSHVCRRGQVRVGYVGTPWPGVECRLSEGDEVLIKAPWNMLGYYKDEEKTRETIDAEGWLHTGDLGELDAQGRLRITGRLKEIFKTAKGKYVAPAPIENRLGQHPAVEACCVVGAGYPQPFALLMLSADAQRLAAQRDQRGALDRSLAELLQQVNSQLDPHERLDCLVVVGEPWTVENGLVTPTMKVKRAAIEARYSAHFESWAGSRQAVIWAS